MINKINAVVIMPGQLPVYVDQIENSYHGLKELFGLDYVCMTTYLRLSEDGLIVLGDDNAKLCDLPLNRVLEHDFWLGPVVVVKERFDIEDEAGVDSDEFYCRMNEDEVNNVTKLFSEKYPPIQGNVEFSVFENPNNPMQQIQQLKVDGKVIQESNYMTVIPFDDDDISAILGF